MTLGGDEAEGSLSIRIRTSTSAQIRTRLDDSDAGKTLYGVTEGWVDERRV